MKRVAVVGSRGFVQLDSVRSLLAQYLAKHGQFVLVSGGADGVDKLAEDWGRLNGLEVRTYQADWEEHGDAAGPKRNGQIVADSDLMLAFWDGESTGTLDAIKRGKSKKDYNVVVFLG